jgi:phosphate:Na+ symporter
MGEAKSLNPNEALNGFYPSVEEADKRFIRLCAQAVSKGTIREHEVTRLLMTNRFFTQSNPIEWWF